MDTQHDVCDGGKDVRDDELEHMERLDAEISELAAQILRWCGERGLKIACAESLTGGLLANAFVSVPGASSVFLGSAVTYDIRAKASVLHVDSELLRREGAVYPEVARQMARRTAQLFCQSQDEGKVIGLSTTGVAGPDPDGEKPVGLVYSGVSLPEFFKNYESSLEYVFKLELRGSRQIIRRETVRCVLQNLRELTGSSQE